MIEERLAFAIDLARQAGALLMQGFGSPMQVQRKGAVDWVTEYDLRSEKLLTEAIRNAYPSDALIAEETGSQGRGAFRWLVDPLDGTSNYARGIPFFSVSVGGAQDGEPVLGVVYDPVRDELFHAGTGTGAWLNSQPMRVSDVHLLDDCMAATSFPYDIRSHPANNLTQFAVVSLRAHDVRRLGSAALNLAYVAAGRLDVFWGMRLSPWDLLAGMVLVSEAGGRLSRLDGGRDILARPTSVLASNGHLHDAVRMILEA
jgi:myo-inositol-1(or 4)-monophosphatase